MKLAIIIGCSKKKKSYTCAAREMYSESVLFSKTLTYVTSHYTCDLFILSAKYGIIKPNDTIDPYDITMRDAVRCSANYLHIIQSVRSNLNNYDKIIAFCGNDYIKILRIAFPEKCIVEPLTGLGIGQRLNFLTDGCLH